jgi:hypothetical protein
LLESTVVPLLICERHNPVTFIQLPSFPVRREFDVMFAPNMALQTAVH